MTQDERWQQQYQQLLDYMHNNQRRPSKHRLEDHKMLNWYKHNKKLFSRGQLSPVRTDKFAQLLKEAENYRHLNQYS